MGLLKGCNREGFIIRRSWWLRCESRPGPNPYSLIHSLNHQPLVHDRSTSGLFAVPQNGTEDHQPLPMCRPQEVLSPEIRRTRNFIFVYFLYLEPINGLLYDDLCISDYIASKAWTPAGREKARHQNLNRIFVENWNLKKQIYKNQYQSFLNTVSSHLRIRPTNLGPSRKIFS